MNGWTTNYTYWIPCPLSSRLVEIIQTTPWQQHGTMHLGKGDWQEMAHDLDGRDKA